MRILSVALALFGALFQVAASPSVRVATYELEGLETVTGDSPPSEEELKPLRQAAAHLKPLDAEIIVLHGLPDRVVARRLVGLLKPASYNLALHSSFRQQGLTGPIIGSPITILTRKQPFSARSMEWRTTGQIDWPGGFGFVGFHSGTNSICVYVAHLPGAPAADSDWEHPLMARRRELAARYLVHHANWYSSTLSNQLVSALITGDFIVEPRGAASAGSGQARVEGAARILQQAGFRIALPSSLGTKTALPDTEPPSLTPRLTALLARNAELISTTQVSSRKTPAQALASYEVAPRLTLPVDTGPAATAPRPVPARIVALDNSIVWLWIGGIAALSMAILFSVWLLQRTFSTTGVLGRRGHPAMVLNVSPFQGRPETYAIPAADHADGGVEESAWHDQTIQAQRRARNATFLNDHLRPQLSRLLRERLVAWLSFQRSALLSSHELGTKQVLELESRLTQVQGQFKERLRNQEERIAELQQEIQGKEKIIRDLLRTQVRLANRAEDEKPDILLG